MTATAVADLLTGDRHHDRPALVDATGREYDHHWFCTTAWKSGNFLRHSGVRRGVTVGVVGDGPLSLMAFLGTALLSGATRFDPPTDLADDPALRALVAPVESLEADTYDLPQGAQRVGYGAKPDQPDIHHYDAGLWSENPSFPPVEIDPDTDLVTDGERTLTHGNGLEQAATILEEYDIKSGEHVVVREPLADLEAVVGGVLAPVLGDAVIVLSGSDAVSDETGGKDEPRGEYAISSEPTPEPVRIDPGAIAIE